LFSLSCLLDFVEAGVCRKAFCVFKPESGCGSLLWSWRVVFRISRKSLIRQFALDLLDHGQGWFRARGDAVRQCWA
jgi:hypothetical protein